MLSQTRGLVQWSKLNAFLRPTGGLFLSCWTSLPVSFFFFFGAWLQPFGEQGGKTQGTARHCQVRGRRLWYVVHTALTRPSFRLGRFTCEQSWDDRFFAGHTSELCVVVSRRAKTSPTSAPTTAIRIIATTALMIACAEGSRSTPDRLHLPTRFAFRSASSAPDSPLKRDTFFCSRA